MQNQNQSAPTQSMRAFFARTDVRSLQDAQKRNPYGSKLHREAFEKIKQLAAAIGADKHFGHY